MPKYLRFIKTPTFIRMRDAPPLAGAPPDCLRPCYSHQSRPVIPSNHRTMRRRYRPIWRSTLNVSVMPPVAPESDASLWATCATSCHKSSATASHCIIRIHYSALPSRNRSGQTKTAAHECAAVLLCISIARKTIAVAARTRLRLHHPCRQNHLSWCRPTERPNRDAVSNRHQGHERAFRHGSAP